MANKTYTTATGQQLDMQSLVLSNEKVRAVGNMNVNARGDVIDNQNKTTSPRAAQVSKSYRKQIGKTVQDAPIVSSKKAAKLAAEQVVDVPAKIIADLEEAPVKPKVKAKAKVKPKTTKADVPTSGLASAIAKASEEK